MATLEELKQQVIHFRDARDWKQFHNFKDMLVSLNLEVAELSEHFQWKSDSEVLESEMKPLGEELADILYWVLLFSADLGIPLEETFLKKMSQNIEKYPIEQSRGSKKKYSDIL